jgi:general secretion pathway protein B
VTVVATPPRAAPAKPRTEDAAAPVPAASAGAQRIVAQRDLPEEIRRQLPPLAIGGSMYSDAPANRMLIINGQLFHEREQPAPGVTLEQIRLKSAVLAFKGHRFELSY